MHFLRSFILLVVLPGFIAGCKQAVEESVERVVPEEVNAPHTANVDSLSGTLAFECREGKSFTLSVAENGETAALKREDDSQSLERIPAETGARYGSGELEVWLADSEGAFIVDDSVMTYQDCTRFSRE